MNSVVELMPNGANTLVTRHNLLSYIYLYANFKLNIEAGRECRAFLSGFRDLIPLRWIRIFSAQEIQMVIGGDSERPLDLLALQRHCTYSGGYHPSQPYIQVPSLSLLIPPHPASPSYSGILENHRIISTGNPERILALRDELLSPTDPRIRAAEPALQYHENPDLRRWRNCLTTADGFRMLQSI
jgi:hypothetical protein